MYQNYITGQTEFVLNYDYNVPKKKSSGSVN